MDREQDFPGWPEAQNIVTGKQTAKQFLLSQIGVQTPTDDQVDTKENYKGKDAAYAGPQRAEREKGKREDQVSEYLTTTISETGPCV